MFLSVTLARRMAFIAPFVATISHAQESPSSRDLAQARALFASAERDEDAGRWAEALDKLRRVIEVKETAGVRYHMGLCEENLGRLATALTEYKRAEDLARRDQATVVLAAVRDPLSNLPARIPSIMLATDAPVAGLGIRIDGKPFPAEILEASVPLDPGSHVIEARADGRIPFTITMNLREGERRRVEITLPVARTANSSEGPATPSASEDSSPLFGWERRHWAWASTMGAAGLGAAGIGFYSWASASQDDAFEDCARSRDACGNEYKTKTRTLDALALGSWMGAAALTGVAIVLWARPVSSANTAPAARLIFHPQGAFVGGTF